MATKVLRKIKTWTRGDNIHVDLEFAVPRGRNSLAVVASFRRGMSWQEVNESLKDLAWLVSTEVPERKCE